MQNRPQQTGVQLRYLQTTGMADEKDVKSGHTEQGQEERNVEYLPTPPDRQMHIREEYS
ncbi:hypothetical protein CRE_29182 [Caenorhabditis remanei]|uniref:Uncharacterized protein n=1 Tax=Caenorhabditis remanei TaxID=31234 RepID=E3ND43_CAERE|nr:hypothetical protein CRE_29182 [Caenorhabditis remanei]